AAQPFNSSVQPLPPPLRAQLKNGFWHAGCPVPLTRLRLVTVAEWGFDGRVHTGQLVVNRDVAIPLTRVFRQLYKLRFPIRHMRLSDAYGPKAARPADGDISGAFECRQAVPSPCSGGTGTGSWSQHAYGEAVDVNPVENHLVDCGMTSDKYAMSNVKRFTHRPGSGTSYCDQVFTLVGWGRSSRWW